MKALTIFILLISLPTAAFSQDSLNHKASLDIKAGVGFQKINVNDWQEESGIDAYPSHVLAYNFGIRFQPKNSSLFISFGSAISNYSEENIINKFEAADAGNMQPVLIYVKQDETFKHFSLNTTVGSQVSLSRKFNLGIGAGLNYYNVELDLHYYNPMPGEVDPPPVGWILPSKIVVMGDNFGIQCSLDIDYLLSKKIRIGVSNYFALNIVADLETTMEPEYGFDLKPERRDISFTGFSANLFFAYRFLN